MGRSIKIYAFPWSMGITKENYLDNPEGIEDDEDNPEWCEAFDRWWHVLQEKYLVGSFNSNYYLACWFRKRFNSDDWSYDFVAEATSDDLKALIADFGRVLAQRGAAAKADKIDELFPGKEKGWARFRKKNINPGDPYTDEDFAEEIKVFISWLKPIAEMEGMTFIYDE